MDLDRESGERLGADHDPALGQGAGVPAGVPARLGGRRLPQPAQHGRERREGPRGRAPPRLRRPHPGPRGGAHLASPPTARSMAAGPASCPAASSTSCRWPTSRRPRRPATTAAVPACASANSRWDEAPRSAPATTSPGWRRAQARGYRRRPGRPHPGDRGRGPPGRRLRALGRRAPTPAATASSTRSSATAAVTAVEGNKLTVAFDKAGEKRVIDSFVEPGSGG